MLSAARTIRTPIRTLSPVRPIEPSTSAWTPSSLARPASGSAAPCAIAPEEREMILSEPIWERSAMRPSVMPSPRYELSGLVSSSRKGRTAIEVTGDPLGAPDDVPRPTRNHQPAPASSRAPTSTAAARRHGVIRAATAAGMDLADVVGDGASASRNFWIEGNRSAGALAIARTIAASTSGGTVWRTTRRLGTGSIECRAITAWTEGPVKGGSATSIS